MRQTSGRRNEGEPNCGMIIVNFKKYLSGEGAVELARICKKIADETKIRIVTCVTTEDLDGCLAAGVECWSQKPEEEKYNFAGTLVNHSDYRIIDWPVMKEGLIVCVCVKDVEEAIKMEKWRPNFIAYEPLELIGNKEKSVSSEHPEDIRNLVEAVKTPVLIGAGVHNAQDVKVGLELGARGVLVATDVVKAENPERELRELAEAFR